jgi:uncharacterized protein (UPF0332 family)
MAFAEDLLEQAYHLARRERTKPRQASLRRAISTAYYALFHLLIREAASHWRIDVQRARLARSFEHGKMRKASEGLTHAKFHGQDGQTAADLKALARAFLDLQEARHIADYDGSRKWTRTEALDHVKQVETAFRIWGEIRNETIAQDYLLSLLTGRS